MNWSEETKTKISKFSEALAKPEELLYKELEEVYNKTYAAKVKSGEISAKDGEKAARTMLYSEYKNDLKAVRNVKEFIGQVWYDSGKYEITRKFFVKALEDYKKDPQRALEQHLVSLDEGGDPVVLDPREERFKRKNPDYLKPLNHDYQRDLWGVCTKKGESTPKPFWLRLDRDETVNFTVPMFTGLKFWAYDRSQEKTSFYDLTDAINTKFDLYPQLRARIEDILKILPPRNVERGEMGYFYHLYDIVLAHKETAVTSEGTRNWKQVIITEGNVTQLRLEPIKKKDGTEGSRIMKLSDDDIPEEKVWEDEENPLTDITCWIGAHTIIDFGEGSRVLVIGTTRMDKEGNVTINIGGVYPFIRVGLSPETEVKEFKPGDFKAKKESEEEFPDFEM